MSTARELLEARKEALSSQLDELLDASNAMLKKMHEVTDKIVAGSKELKQIEHALQALENAEAKGSRIKIMDAVLETLSRNPQGMTAKEMLTELNAKYYGGKLMRHSLSPQLSRLKDRDKKIEYRNERWIRKPQQPNLFPERRRDLKD